MTTPQAQADRLVTALQDNTRALHSVKRRYRWSLVLTALLALSLIYTVHTNYETNVDLCENNNIVRSDIDEKFGSIGDFLTEVISDTPSNRDFIALVEKNLEPRDCSDIGYFG